MKFKLTKLEKNWILYDIGNSAFILMVATMIPIYFDYLAGNANISSVDYLAYWGYAASISTLFVAVIGPIFGTFADNKNHKKPIFMVSIAIGAIGCAMLGFIQSWLAFLIVYVIAKIGYNSSLIFYDSMLPDITEENRMDQVSSLGYAWGYIGSVIPFILSLALVLGADSLGLTMTTAMMISFCIIAIWWILASIPLLKNYQQKYYIDSQNMAVGDSFLRLINTLKNVKKEKWCLQSL
ncbi:MAG: hypothetical protein K0R92_750 [Lachnospiraceae bacterium]|jgi:UMF1 family MFS transporter|nr:hypothetical protein [Lachnospiraceae bacterium]